MGSVAPCRGAVKMEVSMKLLFVFALCSLILPPQQTCPSNCNAEAARMVKVKCVNNGGTNDCTCEAKPENDSNSVDDCTTITSQDIANENTYTGMSAEICASICTEAQEDSANGNECKYWKFVDGTNHQWDQSKSCYLMNDAQCTDKTGVCNQDNGCEVGCVGGGADPASFTCPAQSVRHEESLANKYLSWMCNHFDGSDDVSIDIYDTAPAPGGTTCTLIPSCKKYEANGSLKYKCAEDSENPGSGKWTSSDGDTTHDEDVIDNDNGGKLKDPTCNADPLPLKEGWKQTGMEVNCVDGFAQWDSNANPNTIPSENHCLMFCDYYHVLTFYSKGESGWYYKYTYDGADETEQELKTDGEDVVDNVIKCWT